MFTSRRVIRPLIAAISVIAVVGLVAARADDPRFSKVANIERGATTNGSAVAGYRLGAGDKVRVTVSTRKDLSGTFEVARDLTLALPRIGEVPASGLTLRELEAAIETRLRGGYLKEPRVSVEIVDYRPFFVIGEVNRPGSYPYVDNMTVINAVALGGGFTYRARQGTAFLTRAADPKRKEQPVATDTVVMPGDVVRVPERLF